MPVYDYKCSQHGIFSELATFEHSQTPQPCPQCTELSARIIMMAPGILDMAPEKRKAMATNEKSRHEPEFSTAERRQHDHHHKHGCGCDAKKPGSKLFFTSEGDKMFPSMRPWMISH